MSSKVQVHIIVSSEEPYFWKINKYSSAVRRTSNVSTVCDFHLKTWNIPYQRCISQRSMECRYTDTHPLLFGSVKGKDWKETSHHVTPCDVFCCRKQKNTSSTHPIWRQYHASQTLVQCAILMRTLFQREVAVQVATGPCHVLLYTNSLLCTAKRW